MLNSHGLGGGGFGGGGGGDGRGKQERQTLCDKRDNNFVSFNFPPNFHFPVSRYF